VSQTASLPTSDNATKREEEKIDASILSEGGSGISEGEWSSKNLG